MILFIAVTFILSVNCAFAMEDNVTEGVSDSFDNQTLSADCDAENPVKETFSETLNQEVSDYPYSPSVVMNTVVMNKVVKRYNGVVQYSATFYNADGTPLTNTIVCCGVNNVVYGVNATTDEKGVAVFSLPLANGNYQLYGINPETLDVGNANVKVFDVISGGKNMNVYFNSGKTYTVRVYGGDAKPVKAGQKVTFYVNNKKYSAKTDKNGYAKLKISFQAGTYAVVAQYRDYIVANKIIVKPTLIPLTTFGAKKLGKTFKYKVKLLNNKGKILKHKKITIKFNKKTYKVKTNKKGIAVFKLKTPLKRGTFKIVSSYGKAKATAVLMRY